jgi:hypothetical protein
MRVGRDWLSGDGLPLRRAMAGPDGAHEPRQDRTQTPAANVRVVAFTLGQKSAVACNLVAVELAEKMNGTSPHALAGNRCAKA